MSKKITREEKLIELEIESIGFEGVSIARSENRVYFVKDGIPGDIVLAVIKRSRKGHTECTIKEIIKPSEHRVLPLCKFFGSCGGCT